LQPTRAFLRAININQGIFSFVLQKLEQYVFDYFSATHTTMIFFAVHTNFLWQPDIIICCKQAQQNNYRLAHTADYDYFFAMHMGILLQLEGTLRCKLARQFFLVAIYQTMKFFFAVTHEISVATRTHVCKLSQPPKLFSNLKNTNNEAANHPGSMGFATRSLQTNSNQIGETSITFLCVIFFVTGMNNSIGSGVIIEPGGIDGGGVNNVT
jgi:hypothetical protein